MSWIWIGPREEPSTKTAKEREFEAELAALGCDLEESRQTPGGWKASLRRGSSYVVECGNTAEEVLACLVRAVKRAAKEHK